MIEFSPAVGKNASRWRCEVRSIQWPHHACPPSRSLTFVRMLRTWQVSIDCDYPRGHVTPELASLRNGSFQSPGMKRERAIIDSVSRAGHVSVTEMLEDVARRLNN